MGSIIAINQSVLNSERDATFLRRPWNGLLSWVFLRVVLGLICLGGNASLAMASGQAGKPEQASGAKLSPEKRFADVVASLVDSPLDDAAGIEKLEQAALEILDAEVVVALPVAPGAALDAINAHLAKFNSRDAGVGESYRVVILGSQRAVYALVANFGLGAPSAIRIYAEQGSANHFVLAARIDRSSQQDLLDESFELLPLDSPGITFLTVAGRTDAEQTGVFTAWQFEAPRALMQVWTSDIVEHSSYQVDSAGLQLTFCNGPDETKPSACRSMVRERYRWQDGQWRKVESTPVPVPKR